MRDQRAVFPQECDDPSGCSSSSTRHAQMSGVNSDFHPPVARCGHVATCFLISDCVHIFVFFFLLANSAAATTTTHTHATVKLYFLDKKDTTGTFEIAEKFAENHMVVCLHKHYSAQDVEAWAKTHEAVLPYVAVSAGTSKADFDRLTETLKLAPGIRMICLDVANGYSEFFVEAVQRVREACPEHTIVAGNVVTGEMVEQLILSGADVVKVGIGPGSVCTTRKQTGVGYPQLSAVLECAEAAHGLGGHVVSDGGCACPGDFAKAFGAGADFVMAGGMFAGHDESGGELVERGGRKYKLFYGMSSTTAMKKHAGGVANYRSSEGKSVEIAYRGPIEVTVRDILGGLRSACTYVGAAFLKEMARRTTFIRVSQQLNPVFNISNSKDVSEKPALDQAAAAGGGGGGGESAAKRAKH